MHLYLQSWVWLGTKIFVSMNENKLMRKSDYQSNNTGYFLNSNP